MKLRAIVAMAVVVMAFGAAPALAGPDGSVDMFAIVAGVPDVGACQANTLFIPSTFGQIQISLQARLAGATAGGISGVEGFITSSVDPLPGNWAGGIAPAPGALATGNFFSVSDPDMDGTADTFRGNIVFEGVSGPLPEDGCQVGTDGLVVLGTITYSDVIAPTLNLPNDMVLTFAPSNPVTVPACSGQVIATLCNAPVFTAVCITGGQFYINPLTLSCLVGVETETWSTIKDLYR